MRGHGRGMEQSVCGTHDLGRARGPRGRKADGQSKVCQVGTTLVFPVMAASSAFPLKICKSPDADAALANVACVNPGDFAGALRAASSLPAGG